MKKLEYNPSEVQKLVFKDEEGNSNYIRVSVEEMDYMIQYAIKYQKLHEQWFNSIENGDETIFFLRKCKEIIEDFKPDTTKAMK